MNCHYFLIGHSYDWPLGLAVHCCLVYDWSVCLCL